MKKNLKALLGILISLALIYPLALISGHWYYATFICLLVTFVYFYHFKDNLNVPLAFLNSILFGVFFSLAFWALSLIDRVTHFQRDFYFLIGFTLLFLIVAGLIFAIKKSLKKTILLASFVALSLIAFVLFLILDKSARGQIWFSLLMGSLLGVNTGYFYTYFFRYFIRSILKIFTGIADYLSILIKPFFIFFGGYLTIALLYAGMHNLLFITQPNSLSVPADQLTFLDLILYSLDAMTTGGSSQVHPQSLLAQFINTMNVLTAIVWMTIMLAATIGYSSESFTKIFKKHHRKKHSKKA